MSVWTPKPPQLFLCKLCAARLPKERMVSLGGGEYRCKDHVACMMRVKG